ncbi:hypothetical protein HN51_065143 [Arachis hypogaea]|nr:Transmembrane protein, putative [Arachis hypogaea]
MMVKRESLVTAFLWLLLVTLVVVVYANDEGNTKIHPPKSNHMVYYPQGCRCCWFIWKPMIQCGKACCEDGCCP